MNATGFARVMEPVAQESPAGTVLIINDERTLREAYRDAAQGIGFNALVADTAEHAYRMLEALSVDVVLLDLKVPGGGLDALRQIKARRADAFVIIITSFASVHSAVQAMKLGAYDYLTKPFSPEELKAILQRVGNELKEEGEGRYSRQGFGTLVGRSPEMEKLYRIIAKAAQSTHPVLILGESGTGKELVARSIHYSGPLKDKPFVAFDCGSIAPSLLEGELFGYIKGALPGAQRAKDGLFTTAEGGTLFLDEVGELPVDFQAKLLRAIQDHEIRPVGSARRIPVNVRILAATNRDLEQAVAEGRLRRDLYFRLNVLTLRIPPLRERKQDIPVLVQHILERLSRGTGTQYTANEEALKAMLAYDWPGNVRELENCLERACTMSSGPILRVADLSSAVQNAQIQGPRGVPAGPRIVPLIDIEKQAILNTIDQLNGDKLLAARLLGIGKTTLYRKLKEYARE